VEVINQNLITTWEMNTMEKKMSMVKKKKCKVQGPNTLHPNKNKKFSTILPMQEGPIENLSKSWLSYSKIQSLDL
jgi:hypothetical protein